MKTNIPSGLSNIESWDKAKKFVEEAFDDLERVLNGNIEFDTNLRGKLVNFNFQAANTNYPVVHGLNKVAQGYILVKSDVATNIYSGTSSSDTATVINLKSSAIANVTLLIF